MPDVEEQIVDLNEILAYSSAEFSNWEVRKALQPKNCELFDVLRESCDNRLMWSGTRTGMCRWRRSRRNG